MSCKKSSLMAGGNTPTIPPLALIGDTVLSLKTTSLIGGQNNQFLDSSSLNNTVTRYGNTTQGTFSPESKEAGKWGVFFDGSNDYLKAAVNNAFGSVFSIEAYVYRLSLSVMSVCDTRTSNVAGLFSILSTGNLSIQLDSPMNTLLSTAQVPLNKWTKIKAESDGINTNLFIDDVNVGTGSACNWLTASNVFIGCEYNGSSSPFDGYISNLNVKKSGVVILDACSERFFKDNSSLNNVITPYGNVAITPFSPHQNSAGYVNSKGSAYFDVNGDYLSVSNVPALGSGDFSISCDIYVNGSGQQWIYGARSGNSASGYLYIDSSLKPSFGTDSGTTNLVSPTPLQKQCWYDVEVSKVGTALSMKINNVVVATLTNSNNYSYSGSVPVGASSGSYYFNGYISSLAVKKAGVIVLSLQSTNANIYDSAGFANFETFGNAKVGNGGVVEFDGITNSYLFSNAPDMLSILKGDFLIDLEVLLNALPPSSKSTVLLKFGAGSLMLGVYSDGKIRFWASNIASSWDIKNAFDTGIDVIVGVPCSIRLVKTGGQYSFYKNNELTASFFDSRSIATPSQFMVGYNNTASNESYINGYVRILDIAKGAE